jgi:hypothetical protein
VALLISKIQQNKTCRTFSRLIGDTYEETVGLIILLAERATDVGKMMSILLSGALPFCRFTFFFFFFLA